jgi:predicted outer membrane repeat protein
VVYVGGVDATLDGLYLTGGDSTADDGGAVLVDGGALTVLDSTFSDNQSEWNGGAIAARTGALTVTDSTFIDNTASWYGGALYSEDVITVTGSTFTGNRAEDGGAMEADGGGWIERCTFSGNRSTNGMGGGALFVYTSTLLVSNSTFADNRATEGSGGAINNGGELRILNSTFYSNTATSNTSNWVGWGGAVVNYGTLTVTHGTFVSNTATYSGTTLYTYEGDGETDSGASYLYNSLLGGDTSSVPHCEGTLSANVNNLIEDGSCSPALSGDPRVRTPGDNGGPSTGFGQALQTIPLLSDSPAIDAGDAARCAGSDQRGYARNDWRCDLGAFEMQFTDGDTVSKTVATGGTYTFGPTLVKVQIEDDGGCLTGLGVQRVEENHPNATSGIQTGRYWTLTPAGCSEGFTATLTLPIDVTPLTHEKACRWDTTLTQWDCGQDANNSLSGDGPVAMPDIVTRDPVTQLSDWAVGNNVGPNAISLYAFSAVWDRTWLLALALGLCMVILIYRRWRRG